MKFLIYVLIAYTCVVNSFASSRNSIPEYEVQRMRAVGNLYIKHAKKQIRRAEEYYGSKAKKSALDHIEGLAVLAHSEYLLDKGKNLWKQSLNEIQIKKAMAEASLWLTRIREMSKFRPVDHLFFLITNPLEESFLTLEDIGSSKTELSYLENVGYFSEANDNFSIAAKFLSARKKLAAKNGGNLLSVRQEASYDPNFRAARVSIKKGIESAKKSGRSSADCLNILKKTFISQGDSEFIEEASQIMLSLNH